MTEQEGIEILFAELRGPEGFLPRLLRGEGLDPAGVERVQATLVALGEIWRPCSCIPRDALLALTYLDNVLASPACLDQYPTQALGLFDLYMDMEQQVWHALDPSGMPTDPRWEHQLLEPGFWREWSSEAIVPARNLTEHEANEVLRLHLYGGGFLWSLRNSFAALDQEGVGKALDMIHMAFHTLQETWARSRCIPKDLAVYLATLRSLASAGWNFYHRYPSAQASLYTIGDELGEHLQRALQYISTSGQLTLPWPEA